jgi:glycosyltransferase involved in cell wall biosynthesis
MNICMFSPFSSKASCTQRLISFAKELIWRGHGVSIVLPSFDRHSGFMLESAGSIGDIKLCRPFQLQLRELEATTLSYVISSSLNSLFLRCDIIHVLKPSLITFPGYLSRIVYKTPVIQDIDDLDHEVMIAEKHPKLRIYATELFERFVPSFADHIVTCSSALRTIYLQLGIDEDRITMIPQGVNVSEYEIGRQSSLKSKYNLKDRVIVYLGALNNEVQVSPLINAMKLIVAERKDASCLIVGDGIARPFYERLVDDLGLRESVTFAGYTPHEDVPKLLSISDIGFACFLPPVPSTGGVMKVFEYMASRIPVVVNRAGDLPYYIDFGNAGAITKLDSKSLSNTVIELLNDDRRRKKLGEHAHEYVKNNFDWKVLTKRLMGVYENEQARKR